MERVKKTITIHRDLVEWAERVVKRGIPWHTFPFRVHRVFTS